jgi:hypothetical protein
VAVKIVDTLLTDQAIAAEVVDTLAMVVLVNVPAVMAAVEATVVEATVVDTINNLMVKEVWQPTVLV